jgi:hypothetical protein
MSAQEPKTKKPRGRSPSYPAINLETAIGRARTLWEREKQHPASVDTIVKHWGYKSFNGPASLSLAALKKFGLLEDEGTGKDRTAKLTNLTVDILANPDERARHAAVQKAALSPAIHGELWEKYGANLPSDANLQWEMTRQRGFTETGASEFIPEYRDTITYARLTGDATVGAQDPNGGESHEEKLDPLDPTRGQEQRRKRRQMNTDANVLTIPLVGRAPVIIEGEFPISERDWAQFMAVLNAMKPGLVGEAEAEADKDG